jgi:hypothetical protein
MSLDVPRPIDPSLHPLATGNYRIATPAIQAFYELVVRSKARSSRTCSRPWVIPIPTRVRTRRSGCASR